MIDEKGYKGCDPEKINLCAVELVPSNIDAPKATDIKRGMFIGICLHKLYNESVVTFILLKKNDSDIIAASLNYYNILTIAVADSTKVSEYRYYKATKQHQDEGFDFLSDILATMIEQDKVIKNSEIIDTNLYVKKDYEELCVNINELFPEEKSTQAQTPAIIKPMNNAFNRNNGGIYGNQSYVSEYEKNRRKEEALKAERQRLKEIPMLIRKKSKDVDKSIVDAMLVKIKQIAEGSYKAPELPKLNLEYKEKDSTSSSDDDSEGHIQKKTNLMHTKGCTGTVLVDSHESRTNNVETALKNVSQKIQGGFL